MRERFGRLASILWRFCVRSLPWLAEQIGRLLFLAVSALSIRLAVLITDRDDHADGTKVAALLAVGLVALVLAVGGPTLVQRIKSLGPEGIELDVQTRENIQQVLRVPEPVRGALNSPVAFAALTTEQEWAYEFGTDLLLHLHHSSWNPLEASRDDVERYRELTLRVGQFAIIRKDYAKALHLLEALKPLGEKTADELLALGDAYRLVSWTNKPRPDRDFRHEARGCLEEAAKLDPNRPEIHWPLSFVYDELHYYSLAIAAAERAVALDDRFAPWAYWNMAVSLLKTGDEDGALSKLALIKKGPWWNELYEDEELAKLKTGTHAGGFADLYQERKDP